MSIVDKVVAAITPGESDDARVQARVKARAMATPGQWLEGVLDHHLQIEAAFDAVKAADSAGARSSAQQDLALILNAHSIAEELVLYPALALADEKGHSEMGYVEQSAVKVQMAALDDLDPMTQDYLDKLDHIQGAVKHHMYEEEGTWFPELQRQSVDVVLQKLTTRYWQQFNRYVGTGSAGADSTSSPTLQRETVEPVVG